MHWNANTLVSIFATLLYGAILALVLFSKPRNRLRIIFSYYLLAMGIWSICAFFSTSGLVRVLPWFKAMVTAPIAMMLSIFFFVQNLFGLRSKFKIPMLFYGLFAIIITFTTDIVVQDAYLNQAGELFYRFGSFFWVVAIPGYILMLSSVVELVRGYNTSLDENHRNRIRYLFLGLMITILVSFVNFTELGTYPIDIAANGITALLIAYAIMRHQLLEIRVVLRFGLLYSLTTAIFGLAYYLSISLVLFLSHRIIGQELFGISLIVGALSGFLLSPIRNQAQIWIDRLFYREKYNANLMLQRLSQTTASLLDLEKITNMILDEVMDTLHIESATILINHSENDNVEIIAEKGKGKGILKKIRKDHPIIRRIKEHNKILTRNELLIYPIYKSLWDIEWKELEDFQAELFIPLHAKGEFVGSLIVGPKLSRQPYTRDDHLILSTLANQTAVAVDNARLYEELEQTFIQTISALANAIEIRDTYTSVHSQKIADWAAEIARYLGYSPDEVRKIYWGGLLHDVGKIGIPDEILKNPSKFNNKEWEIMKTHPIIGAKLISTINKISDVAPIVEHSHERYDGLGYPHGKKGDDIPIGARIISVVDAYSAMRDVRPYKEAISTKKAINEIKNNSGTMYDPEIVDAFLYLFVSKKIQ